jgi:hypothetical protein
MLQRRGPDVDARAARRQSGLERLVVADTTGELDIDVELAHQLRQQIPVGAAAECGIEIHQVDPLGPVALPGFGRLQRRTVVGLAPGLALHQAHGLAGHHVDGRQQNQ